LGPTAARAARRARLPPGQVPKPPGQARLRRGLNRAVPAEEVVAAKGGKKKGGKGGDGPAPKKQKK